MLFCPLEIDSLPSVVCAPLPLVGFTEGSDEVAPCVLGSLVRPLEDLRFVWRPRYHDGVSSHTGPNVCHESGPCVRQNHCLPSGLPLKLIAHAIARCAVTRNLATFSIARGSNVFDIDNNQFSRDALHAFPGYGETTSMLTWASCLRRPRTGAERPPAAVKDAGADALATWALRAKTSNKTGVPPC
jgi:hypothetical protein